MFLGDMSADFVSFVQILIALVFGMLLGIERVIVGRTAGPRTYGLVAVGTCLAAILATRSNEIFSMPVDPMPMMNGTIMGVGFIGAGLIVLQGKQLSGLTTAAGIWVSAIIGIAVGFGMYSLALFATVLTLFVFSVMWRIENKFLMRFRIEEAVDHPNESIQNK